MSVSVTPPGEGAGEAAAAAQALSGDQLARLPVVNVLARPLRRYQDDGGRWWWVGVGGTVGGSAPFFVRCVAPDQAHPGRRPRE